MVVLPFREPNSYHNLLRPLTSHSSFCLSLFACPQIGSEEVADDYVATEAPAGEGEEATGDAERC